LNTKLHFSSATDLWSTPQSFFDALNTEFNFTTDVCATEQNAKCCDYFSPQIDGLTQTWSGTCWMNPPYGRTIGKWMKKAYESAQAGATVVCLVPARTDTAWWHNYAAKGEIRSVRGRLKFGDACSAAPFPSAVVILSYRLLKVTANSKPTTPFNLTTLTSKEDERMLTKDGLPIENKDKISLNSGIDTSSQTGQGVPLKSSNEPECGPRPANTRSHVATLSEEVQISLLGISSFAEVIRSAKELAETRGERFRSPWPGFDPERHEFAVLGSPEYNWTPVDNTAEIAEAEAYQIALSTTVEALNRELRRARSLSKTVKAYIEQLNDNGRRLFNIVPKLVPTTKQASEQAA
jgi:phage N-6-adenine-methyltransferase